MADSKVESMAEPLAHDDDTDKHQAESDQEQAQPARRGRKKKDGPKAVAMVTARMTKSKKDEATRILKTLGVTPSDAINQLFSYVVREHRMPFEESRERGCEPDKHEVSEAFAFVSELSRPDRMPGIIDEDGRERAAVQRAHEEMEHA
ncbi:MAG: type II toxin-antitoxin system RelB/DinJ family antitoxin [Eggerthellaceae bacterium]